MGTIERVIIGCLGGLAAVCVKFLGQDYYTVVAQGVNLPDDQRLAFIIGYSLLTPILIFLGGLLTWVTEEKSRLKLLAIGVAAPAMITTWSGGAKADSIEIAFSINPISAAVAQIDEMPDSSKKSVFNRIGDGVQFFFGYNRYAPQRYYVIVGSHKERDKAVEQADEINAENPKLSAYVGVKVPPNEYWPVIVGPYALYGEAKLLKEQALQSSAVTDAYLSPGATK